MKTVWMLDDGIYSYYRIIGVFSTKENAEVVRCRVGGDISEIQLDPAIEEINAGYLFWRVYTLPNSDTQTVEQSKPSGYNLRGVKNNLGEGVVWAKDADHAIKIVNEYRMRCLAEPAGRN